MTRREALHTVSLMFGGTLVGANLFLQGCGQEEAAATTRGFFTPEQVALLDEIGETILPATPGVPGAKDAEIGAFMEVIVADCYTKEEQKVFREGMAKLDAQAQQQYQKTFINLTVQQKKELLTALDAEAKAYDESLDEQNLGRKIDPDYVPDPRHYFTMMKQLTLWGFFTSEVGATQALRYVAVPGRYDGDVDYKPGDRAWAI